MAPSRSFARHRARNQNRGRLPLEFQCEMKIPPIQTWWCSPRFHALNTRLQITGLRPTTILRPSDKILHPPPKNLPKLLNARHGFQERT